MASSAWSASGGRCTCWRACASTWINVQGLGDFLELEVLLDGRDEAQGIALAQGLMTDLGIQPADLVNVAYIDLLVGGA